MAAEDPTSPLHTAPTLLVASGPLRGGYAHLDTSQPRYSSIGTLGAGGMGEVSLCTDRCIGRQVARKVMRPEVGPSAAIASQFIREALVQGQLEHPSIVPVYDVGLDDEGAPYFTMKRVRGTTLAAILRQLAAKDPLAERTYSRHKLLTAFANVCLAVEFAHARGVVHCDLKPSNVMLGDFGEVYVLDWGIAKIGAADDDAATAAESAVYGTPGYMAPEQIAGDAVGPRADVYALGAVLFELLAHEPLHRGRSQPELCVSTLNGSDARPSLRMSCAAIPPELDTICVRATALKPEERFSSPREIHDALQRFLEGDRDLERRREMSREHGRRGAEAAARAVSGGAGREESARARSDALRELGRALVLDPENEEAADGLVALLTSEPAELPAAVKADLVRESERLLRVRARWGAIGYAQWIVFLPVMLWLGVRSVAAFAFASCTWLLAALALGMLARKPTRDGRTPLPVQLCVCAAMAAASAFAGPLVFVPALVVGTIFNIALGTPRSQRALVIGLGCAAIGVPFLLEWAGLVPPSYGFADGSVLILPRMLVLHPTVGLVFVVVASVVLIVLTGILGIDVHEELAKAQRRVFLYAWQLRQLVPTSATGGLGPDRQTPSPESMRLLGTST